MNDKYLVLRIASIAMMTTIAAACEQTGNAGDSSNGSGGSGANELLLVCDANEGIVDSSNPSCMPLADDYTPRNAASTLDTWPACISDANEYVPLGPNIPSIELVKSFQQIDEILGFGGLKEPTPEEFQKARDIYSQMDGIESRVIHTEDEHYAPAPKPCIEMMGAELSPYPDRCVGVVRLRFIIDTAFDEGMLGEQPTLNATRIESALLWFFFVSIYNDAKTAASNSLDVDSMWGKYSAGFGRENPIGFAKYVRARSQQAHDRIWDGLLAVRCWRDLDNPTGVSMNSVLHEKALVQLDRALIRGMAVILRQRIGAIKTCEPAWESAEILGGTLLHEAEARDAEQAAIYFEEISRRRAVLVDKERLTSALDILFPCP